MKRPKIEDDVQYYDDAYHDYAIALEKYADWLEESITYAHAKDMDRQIKEQSKIIDFVYRFAPTSFLKDLKQALRK